MRMKKNWAAIVYSRTYETDFRVLAFPEDFSIQDKKWVEANIFKTTFEAENLKQNPRWSFFVNEKYLVIGVSCYADELLQNYPEYGELLKDENGRGLYLFAGYVTQLEPYESLCYIQYTQPTLDIFAPVYAYVKEKWLSRESQDVVKTIYDTQLNISIQSQEKVSQEKMPISLTITQSKKLSWWQSFLKRFKRK